jgi:hypothetical protein
MGPGAADAFGGPVEEHQEGGPHEGHQDLDEDPHGDRQVGVMVHS